MRLTDFEKETIVNVCKSYDTEAEVRLFGSRVDDNKKGGDIDLLVFSEKLTRHHVRKIKNDLCEILGEQRFDIIIAKDDSKSFVKLAKKGSVLL
jgi:predicted nucleotidyltransferase